ncbi:uncharacterized protein N7496_004739 [Penicillium cataractarum]|uniref:DUF1746 domain-containing protein n=1 Tax=Penicillium cataractarum TaxID=2100454 RepID=A0A9W9SF92_9EURO|nr:uncharacterized protein N7496_004739 [Penicillium cataractarum]KAJ5377330.1 hypothetical protein N7496_004739 [Penicillium cataractarum]
MTDVDAFRDAEHIADVSGITLEDVESGSPVPTSNSGLRNQDNGRVKKLQSAAKVAFIDRLLRDLDILIYCELSALYYMDCSVTLFAIRAIVQLICFTPKSPPFDPTRNQPFVGAILASNLVCMIFHAFFIRPEAGEATRGYLHGGLFIDFIGQKPVPVFRLLVFDTLILLVDVVMLALIIERVKTVGTKGQASLSPNGNATTNANADTNTAQAGQQDHDAEERGVRTSEDGGDINDSRENDTTNTSPVPEIDDDVQDERTTLLADPGEGGTGPIPRGGHPLDSFSTGQAVIMDMGFFTTIRDQWRHSSTPVRRGDARYAPSPQAATFLRERLGLQVGADGRIVRIEQ